MTEFQAASTILYLFKGKFTMIEQIQALKETVLKGAEISFEDALSLLSLEKQDEIESLLAAAHEITRHFHGNKPWLCSIINAKSYLCGEDCSFCAQSVRYKTSIERYQLLDPEMIIAAAKNAEKNGIKNFCIVTSGAELKDDEFEIVLTTVERLKNETDIEIDGSLGFLSNERVQKLKKAGLRRFNNNVQTSREFYPNIVSTHTYDKRIETLKQLRDGGVELCSGGILGMGESREDRLNMAFELKKFQPECLPINMLNPRPGTPLESQKKLEISEILKTIAVYRFVLPKSNIKLAGGREFNLGSEQEKALRGGANGLIIGGYLTTASDPVAQDVELLKKAGYEVSIDPKFSSSHCGC